MDIIVQTKAGRRQYVDWQNCQKSPYIVEELILIYLFILCIEKEE